MPYVVATCPVVFHNSVGSGTPSVQCDHSVNSEIVFTVVFAYNDADVSYIPNLKEESVQKHLIRY